MDYGPIVLLGIMVALGVYFANAWFRFDKRLSERLWRERWGRAAERTGLTFDAAWDDDSGDKRVLTGDVRGRHVEVVEVRSRRCGIDVSTTVHSTAVLGISRETIETRIEQAIGGREHELGDPAFDEAYYIHTGHADLVGEALSPAVRKLCLALRPWRIDVRDGMIHVEVRGGIASLGGGLFNPAEPARNAVRLAVGIAERLEKEVDLDLAGPPLRRDPTRARKVAAMCGLVFSAFFFLVQDFACDQSGDYSAVVEEEERAKRRELGASAKARRATRERREDRRLARRELVYALHILADRLDHPEHAEIKERIRLEGRKEDPDSLVYFSDEELVAEARRQWAVLREATTEEEALLRSLRAEVLESGPLPVTSGGVDGAFRQVFGE